MLYGALLVLAAIVFAYGLLAIIVNG